LIFESSEGNKKGVRKRSEDQDGIGSKSGQDGEDREETHQTDGREARGGRKMGKENRPGGRGTTLERVGDRRIGARVHTV